MLIRVEIEIVFHLEMHVGAQAHNKTSCHKEDEVAQEDHIFEHTITAIHIDGNYSLNQNTSKLSITHFLLILMASDKTTNVNTGAFLTTVAMKRYINKR